MIRKLIVTDGSRLRAKYKAAGWNAIEQAIAGLIAADKVRGIKTSLALLDQPAAGIPKASYSKPRKVKEAIDALFKRHQSPDYVMILGAWDVVPQQLLDNPLAGGDDPDEDVPSDLPYACDAPCRRTSAISSGRRA